MSWQPEGGLLDILSRSRGPAGARALNLQLVRPQLVRPQIHVPNEDALFDLIPRPTPQPFNGFTWPAHGPISSFFSPSHPLGIDIDFYHTPDQPVLAAAPGAVTFAGGDPCCSYGLHVIIEHGNGFSTLYAHLSSIGVSVEQSVRQGQPLGLGGRTGYATGNHLHFEVRLNDAVVDPLEYLP